MASTFPGRADARCGLAKSGPFCRCGEVWAGDDSVGGRGNGVAALQSNRAGPVSGRIQVPGDKSISHRALIIGASTVGRTRIDGLLEADDVLRTASVLAALGALVRKEDGVWIVDGAGVGGFARPDAVLDFGNSGTGARLVMGVLATQPLDAHLTGDASLCRRPMDRVILPLSHMGASFDAGRQGHLPLLLRGAPYPVPMEYESPVPSAQVKSAILLAALNTPGRTTVIERSATRDHTENMLRAFGASIETAATGRGTAVTVEGHAELRPLDVPVPGDPSSAAFPGILALVTPGSELVVAGVGINPLRCGFLRTLEEMGADIVLANRRSEAGEPVADIVFRHGPLRGVEIPAERAPSMIDEYPVVAMAAACAADDTRMRGLGELRVKESNRFDAIVDGLAACGVRAGADGDDIVIAGCGGPPPGGGMIRVDMDHRIAMSFLTLGAATREAIRIDDGAAIGTSFPGFVDLMNGIGARISPVGD